MLTFTAARAWWKVSTCLRAAPGSTSSISTQPCKCQQTPNSTHVTHLCFLQSHRVTICTITRRTMKISCTQCCTEWKWFCRAFHCSCGVTYLVFTHKWGGVGCKRGLCEPCLAFGQCCLCWGARGCVWREESFGGVCYQGTGPNSWLILELLERKSRGLTFPAVFIFCSSGKLFWKYMFAEKCNMFSDLYLQECNQRLFFLQVSHTECFTHPEDKAQLAVQRNCLKSSISSFYSPNTV